MTHTSDKLFWDLYGAGGGGAERQATFDFSNIKTRYQPRKHLVFLPRNRNVCVSHVFDFKL